jgi:antitoxin (DNA-binding transcriptional repressor) of toxin-antitoxin stability system
LTKTIDLSKEPTDLQGLLSLVAKGTEVVLTEGDTPVARLAPIGRRVAGLRARAIETTMDFDESLPEEFGQGKRQGIAAKSMKEMRVFLRGLDTTIEREDDRP